MRNPRAGRVVTGKLVQNADGLWIEQTEKQLKRIERAKVKEAKAEAKRIEATWILRNHEALTLGELTLAYVERFGKERVRTTTLHREITRVLNEAGIRIKKEWTATFKGRDPNGEGCLPKVLEAIR